MSGQLSTPARDPADVLEESVGLLAALATRSIYEQQPDLWRFGESGRARTQEDFVHHFRALAAMDEVVFEAHVRYCEGLFSARGYPQKWLADAWRVMAAVVGAQLPPDAAGPILRLLIEVVGEQSRLRTNQGDSGGAPAPE